MIVRIKHVVVPLSELGTRKELTELVEVESCGRALMMFAVDLREREEGVKVRHHREPILGK